MRILDPTTTVERVPMATGAGTGFAMQRVALLTNNWTSWDTVTDMLAAELGDRFRVKSSTRWAIPISTGASEEVLDEIAAANDVALVGLAN